MPRVVVYLRFPYPRGGFEDPPIVNWDEEKERQLWALLKAPSNKVEWAALAKRFNVPVVYILQQAAWLYEKELKTLRDRMTQIRTRATSESNQPSRQSSVPPMDYDITEVNRSLDSLSSDDLTPGRRLMSASQMPYVDESSESGIDDTTEAFVPQAWSAASHASVPGLTSSSENSVSRSALEEALMNRLGGSR